MNIPNKKRVYILINPISGNKSKKSLPEKFRQKFDPNVFDVKVFTTQYEKHATEIASEAVEKDIDIVVAVGGDGTINETAKALINTPVVLGIIPSGSGNGLARDLKISMSYDKAIDTVVKGITKTIDYGVANGNIFFCTCGVGFDAEVSEKALTQSRRGVLMYAKNMVSTFYKFQPQRYRVESEDGVFEDDAFVITCANAAQYGNNAFIAPHADIQDGKMNISILKPLFAFNLPETAYQMFSKKINNNAKHIEIVTPKAVIRREKEGVMHLDGNALYADKDIYVEIVKQGLHVIVP